MENDRLAGTQHEARREAAPFAAAAALAYGALAGLSAWHGWSLYAPGDWWVWLVLAVPALLVVAAFLVGLGRLGVSEHRRESVIALLGILAAANLVGIALVIGSLLDHRETPTGAQLLASAFVILLVNMITFGLAFWELDSGGPVARAIADGRACPDFQFPQDENSELASPGWVPVLHDYVYIAVTNSIAFSPTDAMPLTHRAKLLMGVEAIIAAVTVLIVAARAVNILGG